jgi:lipoprotein-anchoring transpeptidase ErfK/SrfK
MSMSMNNSRARWLSATALTLILAVTAPAPASAQLFFDWGGQEKVNDTGRMSVRINADQKPGDIIVSFSDRKLFFFTGPGQAMSYPVAIPREQDRWEGTTSVSQKRENPSWTPTPDMIKENPRLPRWVPGGHPMNPLGNRALYLGSSLYRIHGTDAPWTIGTAVSKGCIRMYNKDALDVYEHTKVGAKVLVTWKSYQFSSDGKDQQAQFQPQQSQPAPSGQRSSRAADVGHINEAGAAPRRRRAVDADADFSNPPQAAAPEAAPRHRSPAAQSATATAAPVQAQSKRTKDRTAAAGASAAASAVTDGSAAAVSPIETGSMPVTKAVVVPEPDSQPAPARAAPVVKTQVQVTPAAAGDDMAARALLAAERAAAAAERAAAAAPAAAAPAHEANE